MGIPVQNSAPFSYSCGGALIQVSTYMDFYLNRQQRLFPTTLLFIARINVTLNKKIQHFYQNGARIRQSPMLRLWHEGGWQTSFNIQLLSIT